VIVLDLQMPDETKMCSPDFKAHLNYGSQLVAMSIWTDEDTKALAESVGAAILLDKMILANTIIIPTLVQFCRE
jgi:hypothetical protein